MIVLLKGHVLQTFGLAVILVGLCFLFPDKMMPPEYKETWTKEKISKSRKSAVVFIIVGFILFILGFIIKI